MNQRRKKSVCQISLAIYFNFSIRHMTHNNTSARKKKRKGKRTTPNYNIYKTHTVLASPSSTSLPSSCHNIIQSPHSMTQLYPIPCQYTSSFFSLSPIHSSSPILLYQSFNCTAIPYFFHSCQHSCKIQRFIFIFPTILNFFYLP